MASLLVFTMAAQATTNAWAGKVNSMLGTSNYEVVTSDDAEENSGTFFASDYASLKDMVAAQKDFAASIAAEGVVLLKNEQSALPLDKSGESVTLWGMHTDNPILGGMMGSTAFVNFEAGQVLYGVKEAMAEKGFTLNQNFIDLYASAHSGLLEQIVRNEWGFRGWIVTDMAAAPNYMNWLGSVKNGTSGMLTTNATTSASKFGSMESNKAKILKDTQFQEKMQLAVKSYLYSIARSNAMNGITENTKTNYVLTWWQKAIIGAEAATAALAVIFLAADVITKRKNQTGR